jgi:sulfopyruvate decarboxylase alpha subunit
LDDITKTALHWPDAIHAHFRRAGIRQVGYVPDAGHSRLIELCAADPDIHEVVLTTEEEGVGLIAGAALGGQRAALLMQSSGVGNCINMLSLTRIFSFPFLTLVTMRGEWGEFNPWQVPMGSNTQAVLESSGIRVLRASHPGEVSEVMEAAASQAYNALTPTAMLLSQRLIGTKVFVK